MSNYGLKLTFKCNIYYLCSDCRRKIGLDIDDFSDGTEYDENDKKYDEIETVYEPIDDIDDFIKTHDDNINLDLTFNSSFDTDDYYEIVLKRINDKLDRCASFKCLNKYNMYSENDKCDYDIECINIEIIENKKKNFIEKLKQ